MLSTLYGSLRRRETSDRHAIGRGADVIEADAFAEGDAGRIAPVFATNAELDAVTRAPPAFGGHFHQLPHAIDVEADKGIAREDTLVDIGCEEARGIVATDAQRRLREVIGAEAEEFRFLRENAQKNCVIR